MLARVNFLFAVSLLTLLIFYFTGRFVILKAVSAAAAVAVPYFIAGYTLATLMLTVLVVAKTAIRFEAIATAARAREPTSRSVAAQLLLCLGHLCTFYAIYTLFAIDSNTLDWWPWLLAPLLYIGGLYVAVTDFRKRAAQAPT